MNTNIKHKERAKGMLSLLPFCLSAFLLFTVTACSDDDPDKKSVITIDKVDYNAFDRWLRANYVNTYNIELKYRFETNEADHNFYLIPAEYRQSIELAHIIKYTCLEAFDEAVGVDFTNANFPKQLVLIGNFEYHNNGTFTLGTAEGGKKIYFLGVNDLDSHKNSIAELNRYYLKTIYHEFTHILNQTVEYAADYKLITANGYVADSWSDAPYNTNYLERGFISNYSQKEADEDFAEIFSIYVTNTAAQWEAWMQEAGTDGSAYLEAKLNSVRNYMHDLWGVDMDKLRDIVLRREADVVNGKVDLTSLEVG